MKISIWLATVFCFLAMNSGAVDVVPTERELHVARCVAALEVDTDRLAEQVKAGREELRTTLVERLNYGVAFIGQSYLGGERDEARSRALLKSALEAQKSLSERELMARQSACAEEGKKLLAESNSFSRAVVSRLANRRLKKLLGP